jgi:predicted nuclease with TOPRIM domain
MSSDIEIKLKDLQEKMMEVLTVIPLPFSQPLRETFPLYKIFGENGDYYPKEKETILKWKNLSEEIEKLITSIRQLNDSRVVSQIEKSKLYQNYADVKTRIELASGTSVTLLNVSSTKPTGFIHQDIKKFYEFFNKSNYASKDKKKENTADIVLLYNCSITEIQTALTDNNVSGDSESLCEITGTGKKFAMVSLKAGGDSYRIGRMKGAFDILPDKLSFSGTPAQREKYYQWLTSQQPQEKPEEKDPRSVFSGGAPVFPQNESVNSIFNEIFIGKTLLNEIEFISSLKSSLNRIVSKIGDLSVELKKGWSDFVQKIKNTIIRIFGNIEQKANEDLRYVRSQYSTLFNSWDMIEKEIGILSEAREEDVELVKITDSLTKNVNIFVQQINRINPNSLFDVINEKVKLIENKNLFVVEFRGTTPEDVKQVKDASIKVYNDYFNPSTRGDVPLNKGAFRPMNIFNSNIAAIKFYEKFIERFVNVGNEAQIKKEFVQFASQISAEAIFGNNESLPLIIFNGKTINRMGTKIDFSSGKKLIDANENKNFRLSKFEVSKNKDGTYFVVYLYIIFDIREEEENGKVEVKPFYSAIELRNERGSKFSFKTEIHRTNLNEKDVFNI